MMESRGAAGGLWTTTRAQWTCRQPEASQSAWPALLPPVPYETSGLGQFCLLSREYTGMVVPHHLQPPVTAERQTAQSRKVFLDRCVFDLVNAHPYLSLSNPKLLSWFLCLSPEDRRVIQDEGGFQEYLQSHPALELSQHHVYVKYNLRGAGPAQRLSSANRNACGASTVETCNSDPQLSMVPSDAGQPCAPWGCDSSGSQQHQHDDVGHSSLQGSFHSAFGSPVTWDPRPPTRDEEWPPWQGAGQSPASLASFSVDVELDRHRRGPQPGPASHSAAHRWSGDSTTAAGGPLQSECVTREMEGSSEYYSFNSVHMDGTESGDGSRSWLVSPWQASPPLDPVEAHGTEEGREEAAVPTNESAVDVNEATSSCEDHSDIFHSIMESDRSILACLTSKAMSPQLSRLLSGPPTAPEGPPPSDPLRPTTTTTRDVTVGTEPAPRTSAFSQTEHPGVSDKHVITEVHMTDLDFLAEEFIKLRAGKEELGGQEEKSPGCKGSPECGCVRRAQQAELSLLALQHSMCTQHCWRLYCACSGGAELSPRPNNPPAIVAGVLHKLESDYNHMRAEILAGVPLEQLRPLCVDTDSITTGARYTPAQLVGDVLGNEPCRVPPEPQAHGAPGPDDESGNGCQGQRKQRSRGRRDVGVGPARDREAVHAVHKQEEQQTTAGHKEADASEVWYDAAEELECEEQLRDSGSSEAGSSVLCVSSLPSTVTESDVLCWFERYQATDVRISALNNDFRLAVVMTGGPQHAHAAVAELNGSSMQGHTLHVERIHGASGGGAAASSCNTAIPHPPGTERQLPPPPPPGSGSNSRKRLCTLPSAQGTCVPQHYGTMGSFDTLMGELARLHPRAPPHTIVEALVELRAAHGGVLSGLPLRTIRDMASELLGRAAGATAATEEPPPPHRS